MSVEVVTSPLLVRMRHGFLGRRGGVSTGVVAGLNVGLGSADDPNSIADNRRRATMAVAPGAALVTVYQVHSPTVVIVTAPCADDERPNADALVTDRTGLVLGILTADCAPVLLADLEAGVIGAAHAGWKGALGGVTDATVTAMESIGGRRHRIRAVIGPCIAQPSYEVDDAFRIRFEAAELANGRFFVEGRPGHAQFDLPAYVAHRLTDFGVGHVEALLLDTFDLADRFFSFRRATLDHEPDYGRQISLIALP